MKSEIFLPEVYIIAMMLFEAVPWHTRLFEIPTTTLYSFFIITL